MYTGQPQKWTEAVLESSRPPVLGKENCDCYLSACHESHCCRCNVVTQDRNCRNSGRLRNGLGSQSGNSSSRHCCVVSNDVVYSDKFSSVNSEVLTTAYDLCSRRNHVGTASGRRDFCKKLTQNKSKTVDTTDTIFSQSVCDTSRDAETTSGLNDFRDVIATTSAESETVEELQRKVEGCSKTNVVCCEETSHRMFQFVPDSKHMPQTATDQRPT